MKSSRKQRGFTLIEIMTYLGLFTLMVSTIMMTERFAQLQSTFEAAHSRAIFELNRLDGWLREDLAQAEAVKVTADGAQVTVTRRGPATKPYEVRYGYFDYEGYDEPVFLRRSALTDDVRPTELFLSDHLAELAFEVVAERPLEVSVKGELVYQRSPIEEVFARRFERVYLSRVGKVK